MRLLALIAALAGLCVGCQMVFPAPPAPRPIRMKPADPDPHPDEDNDYNYTAHREEVP